jgi:methylase of polypeptide subunit release factors
MPPALFAARDTDRLRTALQPYTVEAIHECLGADGRTALGRGDYDGVARELSGDGPLETLIRLFVLAGEVTEDAARAALQPLPLDAAAAAGLLTVSAGSVRAELDIRPYGQADAPDWWVVSNFGSDQRPGPVATEHVIGVSSSALTLAQATPRDPVRTALDIGTGCGVQALHLSMHADAVLATDVSERALQLAATTAALSGVQWELRHGSFLDPVADDEFDLVIANPPFVVSPGGAGIRYRDSGMPGDGVSAMLARGIPGVLAPGGVGQLLANWIIPTDRPWEERVADWFDGRGCDAWVWQRETLDLSRYVSMWLVDAGERAGTPRWTQLYNAWLDWLVANNVAAIGMGLITMWRTDEGDAEVVVQDVRQAVEQPIGYTLPAWHARQRWLAAVSDAELLEARLRAAEGLVRERVEVLDDGGWRVDAHRLRQTRGMCWEADIDDSISALVAGCDSAAPLHVAVSLLASSFGMTVEELAAGLLPAVRELISRGFLLPQVPG